ncbi:hypothetical protein A2V82_13465 [candidate division KSB1 bacterium RBG_16_48_16]|nr:MAG: hypothetical protein A2V82_13465 [candidate division KSB1 bacterium RBG_16_48_16]
MGHKRSKRIKIVKAFLSNIRISRRWLRIIGGLVLLYIFVAGDSGIYTQYKVWKEGRSLQEQIRQEQARQAWLLNERSRLETDPARIEKEAREKYMMGQDDEIIIKVKEKSDK